MRVRQVVKSVALGVGVVVACPVRGIERHWNANFGSPNHSGTWDLLIANWNTLPNAAGTQTTWTEGAEAMFDVGASYTVTIAGAMDASALSVSGGRVTLSGTGGVGAPSVEIGVAATLLSAGDRFLRAGTTALQLDGTLQLNQTPGVERLVELRGGGLLRPGSAGSASLRITGDGSFAGRLSDFGSSRLGLLWSGGQPGVLTLSGDNDAMTGSVLLSVSGSVLRLAGPRSLGGQTYLRFEGGSDTRTFVELAGGDLSRSFWANSNSEGGGGLNCAAPAGFYATGADRNLELLTSPGSTTPGIVAWGSHGLSNSTLALGHGNATHALRWVNPVNLNGATRTLEVRDGPASVEAELSGDLSGDAASSLVKTGTGTLRLAGSNSYRGSTTIAAGTLLLTGTHIDAGDWTVQSGATLGGSGVIGLAAGKTLRAEPGGRLSPGTGVGMLTVAGAMELQSGSSLAIELHSPGVCDRIVNPTGSISLGGELLVSLPDGFTPDLSDRFRFLEALALAGGFDHLNAFGMVEVSGGVAAFEIDDSLPTERVLTRFTRLGDVSLDGVVNNQDIAPFVAVLTGTVAAMGNVGFACDANRDGVVNNQDIAPFVSLLTGGSTGQTNAGEGIERLFGLLPEPAPGTVLASILLSAATRGRRSRTTRA